VNSFQDSEQKRGMICRLSKGDRLIPWTPAVVLSQGPKSQTVENQKYRAPLLTSRQGRPEVPPYSLDAAIALENALPLWAGFDRLIA
jgi:hypothetical protein